VTDDLTLQRGSVSPFVPAPTAIRVGPYVYTSSIYPIDAVGHAIRPDELLGEAGPSTMEIQARACLQTLDSVLAKMGSGSHLVLKVDVHLAFAADFYEFLRVWREHFVVEPPARTVIEVGDVFPFPGVCVNLDAVALTADANLERRTLQDPVGPDPRPSEGAPHAIHAGHLIFCSGFPATDFESGLAVGRRPGFPHYGSEPRMQAEYVFDRLNRVLSQAGTSVAEAVESQLYEPDLQTFNDVDAVWGERMALPPPRSSMGIKGLIVPGAHFVPNLVVLVPDKIHQKQESRKGVPWHPSERRVNFSPIMKAGPWRYFAGQIPSVDFNSVYQPPPGLPYHHSSIEEQAEVTFNLLSKELTENETDWDHCYQVRIFLIEPKRDYRGFVRSWSKLFPDPSKAPTLAYVPSTKMMIDGPLIEIDPSCVAFS
jgi:enamine deaminase RidA (YjgF/YER057c/UK114 family)